MRIRVPGSSHRLLSSPESELWSRGRWRPGCSFGEPFPPTAAEVSCRRLTRQRRVSSSSATPSASCLPARAAGLSSAEAHLAACSASSDLREDRAPPQARSHFQLTRASLFEAYRHGDTYLYVAAGRMCRHVGIMLQTADSCVAHFSTGFARPHARIATS